MIYNIQEEEYHADPCDTPSLSSSIAKSIWEKSCKHAWLAHPKLNPDYEPENKKQYDLGRLSHALLLEGDETKLVIIDADDYRGKAAKEQRDSAYLDNKIPVLLKDYDNALVMVNVAKAFINETELQGIFQNGKPEQTIIFEYEGALIRTRLDWLTNDRAIILDYKTGKVQSKPEVWIRKQLFNANMDIQAYLYTLAVTKVEGIKDCKFIFFVQENFAPYACSLIGASPSVLESGKKKFNFALHKWKWCLQNNIWPAYDTRIAWAESPTWNTINTEIAEEEEID